MSFRFFRYVGDKPKYQIVDVEVKKYSDGTQYRSLMLTDAHSKYDATIFPIENFELARFIADWFDVCCERVEDEK